MHAMTAFIEENRRFGRRRLDRHVCLTSTGLRHHFATLRSMLDLTVQGK
jgi:hypothetical protein